MPDPHDDKRLVELYRAGDEEAARILFDQYLDRLVALARRRLSQRLAGRLDPEDIVQSVFRTFFGRIKQGQFRIESQDDLCKLLMRITVHKTLRQIAYHQAAKRNAALEAARSDASEDPLLAILGREPAPDAAAAFLEELEQFLAKLQPEERKILEMRLQGYSNADITQELHIYDRKIRRIIERVRQLAQCDGIGPFPATTARGN